MNVEFTPDAWEEFMYWVRQNRQLAYKIDKLLQDIRRDPFGGIGKPEALKHELQGFWSRRITQEHRLVYEIVPGANQALKCVVVSCRYHYGQ